MRDHILKYAGLVLVIALAGASLHPDVRKAALSFIHKKQRVILAVARSSLDDSGEEFQILKVKTDEGLFIEVYGSEKDRNIVINKLLSSAKLPDKKDGYFTYNGQVTNLAVDNINNDQFKEILATSFDDNMVAHLNVYRFIKGQTTLQLVELN